MIRFQGVGLKVLFGLIGLGLLLAAPVTADAQTQIKPRILILMDTSGSMARSLATSNWTNGDSSTDPWSPAYPADPTRWCCPGLGGSRAYAAKNAMFQMVMASGDIEFALMRFPQAYVMDQASGWNDTGGRYRYNQTATTTDVLRYNDGGNTYSQADRTPWLCVGFGAGITENDLGEVAMWLDHHEYADGSGSIARGLPDDATDPLWADGTEQELRFIHDSTPLGEAVEAAYNYFQAVMLAEQTADPEVAACRPYSLIILTDGLFTGINPVPEVDALYDDLGVDSWVIGLDYGSDALDHMAEVGGCHFDPAQPLDETPYDGNGPDCADPAGHAFLATTEESLSAILYQIVAGSILIEVCNGADDDCDGETDEGYDLYCDLPLSHPAQDLCTDPGESVCDGQDDNCDGETDEDLTPPDDGWGDGVCSNTGFPFPYDPWTGTCTPGIYECQGGSGWVCTGGVGPVAELCNGLDDDCDGEIDEDVLWNPLWGPNECGDYGLGECDLGYYYCDDTTAGNWVCTGASTPGDEGTTCDFLDNDCDGESDEGISQACGGCDPLVYSYCTDPNEGICQQGVQYCDVDGADPLDPWLPCSGSIGPKTNELCNLLDDDCDGATDEDVPGMGDPCGGANPNGCPDYPLGACPDGADQGECVEGALACVSGSVECVGNVNPVPEGTVCDDMDNDCDGKTDEGISQACGGCDSDIWSYCTDPEAGQCTQGFQYCDPLGPGWGECQGDVGPGTETCDNIDNDCDGETDETFPQDGDPCGGAPGPDPEEGACSQGTLTCSSGVVECTGGQGPVPEGSVCDDVDNDCDGETDEWITVPCGGCDSDIYSYCGDPEEGVCQQGFEYCPAASDPNCYGSIGPSTEVCNGFDDDCDAATDEDIPDEPDACGACGDGTITCQDGELTCVGGTVPEPEVCNGLDDDCDGFTDEGVTQPCGGGPVGFENEGQCQQGIQQCDPVSSTETTPVWFDCVGSVEPTAEICDGLDNDCDADTDEEEDLLGVGSDDGAECSPGYGICDQAWLYCAFDGVDTYSIECCVALDTDLTCIEPAGPEPEICDGLDNDCDSLTDEEFPTMGDDCDPAPWVTDPDYSYYNGECEPGAIQCVWSLLDGYHTECVGGQGPIAELCNLLDDDCDAETDEGVIFDPPDCNLSNTDDPWEGICEPGTWVCVDGYSECEGLGPEEETCNGLDDDCDAETDEDLLNVGEPCGEDLGICEPGTIQCVCDTDLNCDYECEGGTAGVPEDCNLLDDDCDGLTDEDLVSGITCSNSQTDDPNEGICEEGEEICVGGEWICNANEPMPEICDGKDNDCDGLTDEDLDVECPDGVCIEGECAELCEGDELLCPEGKTCEFINDQWVCISDVCNELAEEHLPCVDNPYWCSEGYVPPCTCEPISQQCVDACHNVTCPEGFVCVPEDGGTCHSIEEGCFVTGCPEGEICIGNECVDDPCFGVECTEPQYCNGDGECVDPCVNMDCPDGWGCFEGECVEDPCAGVICDTGLSCVEGECVVGDCWGVICEYYEICVDGDCVEDPCWNVECPNGLVCIDGGCYEYEPDDEEPDTDSDTGSDTDTDTDTDSDTDADGDADIGDEPGMKNVLATGMGGCLCTGAPGSPGTGGVAWLVLLLGAALAAIRLGLLRGRALLIGLVVSGLLLAAGCQVDPYGFKTADGGTDGDTDTDTDVDTDTDIDTDTDTDSDTSTETCQPADAGDYTCDEVDDDCDDLTDEDVDTENSIFNCGGCNIICEYDNAYADCIEGECQMGDCSNFFFDNDTDTTNGCEYFCQPTGESDFCNGIALSDTDPFYVAKDDDCDGLFDEDVDFENSPVNCGWCGHVCNFEQATPQCVGGECQAGDCNEGFHDLDTDPGCEYECDYLQETELCNAQDDNCDGTTDEDDPESGADCGGADPFGCDTDMYTDGACPDGADQGVCAHGTEHCVLGSIQCQDEIPPADDEACNDLDDDCDGVLDEEVDIPFLGPLDEDPSPGPLCGVSTGICEQGRMRCAYADSTDTDHGAECCADVDEDGVCIPPLQPGDVLETSPDSCDGYDNDCDGLIDEDPDNPDVKMTNGECWWPAIVPGEGICEPGQLTCFGSLGVANWICVGATGPQAETCDDVDEDCDGQTDEGVMQPCGGCDSDVWSYCGDPNEGRCQQGIEMCSTTGPGWEDCAGDIGPIDELCNAIDDDCDGSTDEDVTSATDPQVGQPCPGKVGDCAGLTICNSTNGEIECDNPLEPGVNTETCDGNDNDCDGFTDEGLVTACGGADPTGCDPGFYPGGVCPDGADQGLCVEGVSLCVDGEPTACQGSVEAECLWDEGCDACDGVDNDCDGVTDEDYSGGGTCGPCDNGTYICLNGIEQCSGGTVPTAEVCDGIDNNCDDQTDEGLFQPCGGATGPDPDEGACQEGIQYCDPDLSTPLTPVYGTCQNNIDPIAEICDGEDNDCDASTDEMSDLTPPVGVCDPDCPGTWVPICGGATGWDCDYECTYESGPVECDSQDNPLPVESICDGEDNNCDGETDEQFDLNYDVNNCGACEADCETDASLWPQPSVPTNVATFGCIGGTCVIIACDTDYWDDSTNGWDDCDIGPCTQDNFGIEECDGQDDDCDGQTDEGVGGVETCNNYDDDCDGLTDGDDPDLILPPNQCTHRLGECAGVEAVAVCVSATSSWDCNYDLLGDVELAGDDPVDDETWCDGKDNDCDGWSDEGPGILNANALGTTCDNDPEDTWTGYCVQEGTWACDSTPSDPIVCCETVGVGGVCTSVVPDPATLQGTETCNGEDDDCDGTTDEGVGDSDTAMQIITISNVTPAWSYEIFAYEASKPDAQDYNGAMWGDSNYNKPGSIESAACSFGNKIPWTMVNHDEAEQACWALNATGTYEVGGWDLCTIEQWEFACKYGGNPDPTPHTYPYGNTYAAATCNGHDYNTGWDHLVGCGTATSCYAEWGTPDAFDLSGNIEEWTATDRVVGSDTLYEIRGGSYNDLMTGLTCDFDFWAAEETFTMPNLGFRCCRGDDPVSACEQAIAGIANHPYDFEGCSDDGWTLETEWEAGAPGIKTAYEGSCVMATDLDDTYDVSQDDEATSPVMNLSACTGASVTLHWYMWHDIEYHSSCNYDWGDIQVWDGSTWVTLVPDQGYSSTNDRWCGPPTFDPPVDPPWMHYTADVSDYMAADFQIRFRMHSDNAVLDYGMYVDNVFLQSDY